MNGRIIGVGTLLVGALLGLTIVFGSWYTIDQGERGVILRNGAITGTAEPGLGFKIPLVDDVERISVQSRAIVYNEIAAYSRDQQPAMISLSVNYRIPSDQVTKVYSDYGGEGNLVSRLIERRLFEQVKNVFGQYNAVSAIQDRARLNADTQKALQSIVKGPVIIESVQIENIDFSDVYEQSIEARMLAEVEVQKLQQNAEREKVQAEITVTKANAEADALRAQAAAQADAVRLAGNAEADAIRAKGEALRDNPTLIDLTAAERWNGTLPTTMVPSGSVPFVNVK